MPPVCRTMRRIDRRRLPACFGPRRAWIGVDIPQLDPDALRRIRARYDQVRPAAFAAAFFDHLFAAMPEIRPLLPADLVTHGEYVEAAIAVVIRNLADLDVLIRPLEELGAEHARRGIHAGQLVNAHPVLMAAIRSLSAERWSGADERDWAIAFSAMLAPMVRGAATELMADTGIGRRPSQRTSAADL
jgi:hemoglobin-like flavoprotein